VHHEGLTAEQAPHTSRREEKTAQIRESIMAAALEVFSEDTFTGARIQHVASRADVALGTIYNYFDSKEALANEVYRRCKADSTRYCVDPTAGGSSRETFGRWWATMVNFYTGHPQAFIFLETQDHSRFLDGESRKLRAKIDRQVLADFRTWQKSGEVRPADPKLLLAMIVAVFAAIVLEAERRGRPLDPEALKLGEDSTWAKLQAPA
jgi:AcrR family transcriptional regulator